MNDHLRRVFLSYASADTREVDLFDLELRRRGVPMWRDRDNLAKGRLAGVEIEKASREAAGFVFYLTRAAANSRWVRETERSYALDNSARWSGFGIVPVFRHAIDEVTERMQRQGEEAARDPSIYDLGGYNGYVIDPAKADHGRIGEELRSAADAVIASLLKTTAERGGRGERLKVGLVTREGPALVKRPLDLVLDWTEDYPPVSQAAPSPGFCRDNLLPALQSFRSALRPYPPALPLHVVPQCHLTMALAFGFEFRRNVGIPLEVSEPHAGDVWSGPAASLDPLEDAWTFKQLPVPKGGPGVALAVNITRPREDFQQQVQDYLAAAGPAVSQILYFEPAEGASKTVLRGRDAEEIHRMAVAVVERMLGDADYRSCDTVHLLLAAPPGFAILLAQQLSNTRPVQTYEWSAGGRTYVPCYELVSS